MSPAQQTDGVVLILEADHLYASALQRAAKRALPHSNPTSVGSIADAVARIATGRVDLFVTRATAPDGDTLDLLFASTAGKRLVRHALVITGNMRQHILASLRALPINGVFDPTSEDLDALVRALGIVASGGPYWSRSVLERLRRQGAMTDQLSRMLTPTEELVLAIVGDGADDREAGRRLGLKAASITSVRRALHRKLGVRHSGKLVRAAVQHGYVRVTPDATIKPGFAMTFARCAAKKLRPDITECSGVLCPICPAPWCGRSASKQTVNDVGAVEAA